MDYPHFVHVAASRTTVSAPRRRAGQRLPDASNARTWWIIGLMVSAFSFCMVMHLRQSPYQLSTKPIDAIQLGDNVPGVNPGESADLAFGTTVDPESWRHIRLTGQHSSGALIEIDLLRPQSWLAEHNAEEGAVIPVEFGRIGIVGPVRVDSIQECPEIRAGPGKSVTGIYRHHDAPTILDLETSNGERIGVTPDHRFWSEDQQAFIPAGELVPGETLKLLNGTTQLADITTRPDTETVYTLEVQVEHVYHIAQSGILVHNCNTGIGAPKGLPFRPQLLQGNKRKGLEHIVRGHWHSSGIAGKSRFAKDINLRGLRNLIDEAANSGAAWRVEGGSRVLDANIGRVIGTDPTGGVTAVPPADLEGCETQ